jgi:hypothetical protein
VVDLALAPTGERVGLTLRQGERHTVEVVELEGAPKRVARVAVDPAAPGGRRLTWISPLELVLWEPAGALDGALAPRLAGGEAGPQPVWSAASPPAHRADVSTPPTRSFDTVRLNDEDDARWKGRSFVVVRSPDAITGRASESLRVDHPNGDSLRIPLPGEACGPPAQYGRPHARISADGRIGFDLRHVDGGCHAVAIHLETGDWRRIDSSKDAAVCSETRRVPLPHLEAALRGYVRDLEDSLEAAGGDPGASYALRIDPDGRTHLESRNLLGEPLTLVIAPFPLETPLSRIEVTAVANAGQGSGDATSSSSPGTPKLQPL